MLLRRLCLLFAIAVCVIVVPLARPKALLTTTAPTPSATSNVIPTPVEFAALATSDALATLRASLQRYKQDVRGYRCVMLKHERIGGRLGPTEQIRIAFRDDPFAVKMIWDKGAGLASSTLYVEGENDGQLLARSFVGVVPSDPEGALARKSARYSIRDFGIARGAERTLRVWQRAADNGRLKLEYLGIQPLAECGNRNCYFIRRTCEPDEVDNFAMRDPGERSATESPRDAIRHVTIMIDVETWQHIGSDLRTPDGSLLANYYFRDLEVNPTFTREEFLASALKK
jgi:Protein of unknown function (DUF1571)